MSPFFFQLFEDVRNGKIKVPHYMSELSLLMEIYKIDTNKNFQKYIEDQGDSKANQEFAKMISAEWPEWNVNDNDELMSPQHSEKKIYHEYSSGIYLDPVLKLV